MSIQRDVIEQTEVAEHCPGCGLSLAVILRVDGEWRCDNCGRTGEFEVAR